MKNKKIALSSDEKYQLKVKEGGGILGLGATANSNSMHESDVPIYWLPNADTQFFPIFGVYLATTSTFSSVSVPSVKFSVSLFGISPGLNGIVVIFASLSLF